jgi:endonuclease/exonuclease/phosphatase family metal-dependent hydrolase
VVLLITVLRAWLPSLITIYGDAGDTPAEQMGAFALVWFAAALVAVPVGKLVGADRLAVAAALVVALAVIAAGTSTKGGTGQLYLLCAALLAGLVWLICAAMTVRSGRWAAIGLTAGLGASVALHAALDTVDLVWRSGPLPALGLATLSCAFVGCVAGAVNWSPADVDEDEPAAPPGRAGARGSIWLLAGPAIGVTGIVTGATARADAAADAVIGLPAGWASATVVAATLLATALAARPRLTRHPAVPAVLLVLGVAGATAVQFRIGGIAGVSPSWTVGCQAVGALALGAVLGWVGAGADARAATSTAADRPARRGFAAGLGALLLLALVFVYYAAYEIDFGVPNTVVLVAAAVGIGVAAVRVGPRARRWGAPTGSLGIDAAIATSVVVAATAVVTLHLVTAPAPVSTRTVDDFSVRLVAYNIRMGFGLDGRFDPETLAATIGAEQPDIVLLSEVDRGWFLNGGHDDLQLIADRLGMRAVFAPAADPVWGDALLTRLPIVSVRSHPLPRAGAPIGAQALAAVVSVGKAELGVVGTHLQAPPGGTPAEQAREVARIAGELAKPGRPVVLAGDLNLTPGSKEFASLLKGGLIDALAKGRPLPTYPSDKPRQEIDHVLTSPNVVLSDVVVPESTASDHRALAVTLALENPEALRPAS